MKGIHDVWSKRFLHYMEEVQKYMRFVFTGHIAIVFVFVVGALGYQYSEWLKIVDPAFPAQWLVAIIVGSIVAFSSPTTLIREPDAVYLLPLESSMDGYFKKALRWTFMSQLLLPVGAYVVAIPLLNAVTFLSVEALWLILVLIVVLKYVHVRAEFYYRYNMRGRFVWVDKLMRIAISIVLLYMLLSNQMLIGGILLLGLAVYVIGLHKKIASLPVPYEHFIQLEQSRMTRFYRFANLFTDVPHLHGAIRRRKWLDFVYTLIGYDQRHAQMYLVMRTFIRTDDHFYLWVRLTAISMIVAAFAGVPIVVWIIVGALSFATVLQLKYALLASHEFRMDMLYPVARQRKQAVTKWLRILVVLQAVFVLAVSITQPILLIAPIIILVVGEATIRLSKNPS